MSLKLFIAGDPDCGKTTLVRNVIGALEGSVNLRGFYKEDLLERGKRRGFQGHTLDGETFLLADIESGSEIRLGPYGVETEGLEQIGIASLQPKADTGLVVLDEIGKMEAFSTPFKDCVEKLLAGPVPVLGTVAIRGVGLVKRVRRDPRVTLLRMRRTGREALLQDVLRALRQEGIGARSKKR